jgi:predicted site-specific integrase-resolvase
MNYFRESFADMKYRTLQNWLREAQIQLPQSEGAKYEILCEGIKAAASELLYRWRNNIS